MILPIKPSVLEAMKTQAGTLLDRVKGYDTGLVPRKTGHFRNYPIGKCNLPHSWNCGPKIHDEFEPVGKWNYRITTSNTKLINLFN
jgi:hypothetical protein